MKDENEMKNKKPTIPSGKDICLRFAVQKIKCLTWLRNHPLHKCANSLWKK